MSSLRENPDQIKLDGMKYLKSIDEIKQLETVVHFDFSSTPHRARLAHLKKLVTEYEKVALPQIAAQFNGQGSNHGLV